jgi:hypothetical protein
MFDHGVRLELLLARHRDAVFAEPGTLLRRDQLLVADRDVPRVEELLRRWWDSREQGTGVTRLRLAPAAKVDVCELSLLARERGLAVGPNHLVRGQPMWWAGPADRPRPARAVALPPSGPVRRDVTVAVLDTGLDPHPWYTEAGWFAAQREGIGELLDADLDHALDAQAGHGTFVAGVVLQHAPSARILARRVIGGDGIGDELTLIRALRELARADRADRPDVINLSVGCHTFDDRPSPL